MRVHLDSLRQNITLIPQEPQLFHRSLLENIRYGKPDATEAEVMVAAKQAHCHEFITELDEATSALGSVTEKKIQGSLHHIMKNKTTLVIAHRLSTLLEMDRILFFEDGRIVEDGSLQALREKNGLFSKLWEMQYNKGGQACPPLLEKYGCA